MNSVDFSYPKIRNMWKGYFLSIPIDQEEINMAQSVFMKADEVQELLGVSRSEAYRIMKKLNDDLKEKGFKIGNKLLLSSEIGCLCWKFKKNVDN